MALCPGGGCHKWHPSGVCLEIGAIQHLYQWHRQGYQVHPQQVRWCHYNEQVPFLQRRAGCHPEGSEQAWKVGPHEHNEVQQGQMQGVAFGLGQSPVILSLYHKKKKKKNMVLVRKHGLNFMLWGVLEIEKYFMCRVRCCSWFSSVISLQGAQFRPTAQWFHISYLYFYGDVAKIFRKQKLNVMDNSNDVKRKYSFLFYPITTKQIGELKEQTDHSQLF